MLTGHIAAALALRWWRYGAVPLWLLAVGAALSDVLFVVLAGAGAESLTVHGDRVGFAKMEIYAPYSHGLAWAAVTAGCLAGSGAVRLWRGVFSAHARRGVALAVLSHYACDWVVHSGAHTGGACACGCRVGPRCGVTQPVQISCSGSLGPACMVSGCGSASMRAARGCNTSPPHHACMCVPARTGRAFGRSDTAALRGRCWNWPWWQVPRTPSSTSRPLWHTASS